MYSTLHVQAHVASPGDVQRCAEMRTYTYTTTKVVSAVRQLTPINGAFYPYDGVPSNLHLTVGSSQPAWLEPGHRQQAVSIERNGIWNPALACHGAVAVTVTSKLFTIVSPLSPSLLLCLGLKPAKTSTEPHTSHPRYPSPPVPGRGPRPTLD